MKRVALIREIRKAAKVKGFEFELVRSGGKHDIWRCATVMVPIPRHGELGPKMEFEIRAQLQPDLGRGGGGSGQDDVHRDRRA